MEFDQALNQRKTQPQAAVLAVGGALGLDEQVEQLRHRLCVQPDAIVGHLQHEHAGLRRRTDRNAALVGRVARGIAEQVADHLHQAGLVAADKAATGGAVDPDRVPLGRHHRAYLFQRLVQHQHHVDPLHVQRDQPLRDARDVDQVFHQARHVADLAVDHLPQVRCARVVHVRGFQQHRGHFCGRERVAHFMAQDGQELVLAAIGQPQLLARLHRLGDVLAIAYPFADLAGGIAQGHAVGSHEPVLAVAAPQAIACLITRAASLAMVPGCQRGIAVIGVYRFAPALAVILLPGLTAIGFPGRQCVHNQPGRVAAPQHFRQALGERTVTRFALHDGLFGQLALGDVAYI